jgi:hypothetical protein
MVLIVFGIIINVDINNVLIIQVLIIFNVKNNLIIVQQIYKLVVV